MKNKQKYTGLEIAVVGIACRYPGAGNWRQYWDNLSNGVESIVPVSDDELRAEGVDEATLKNPEFIKVRSSLKDKDTFDYAFFDYSQSEAALMNPVHRIFHECVWEALEDAGYNPEQVKGPIGVYAGAGDDLNWRAYSVLKNTGEDIDDFTMSLINSKDNIATMLSYKLDLKGPSFSVYTACSTSLTAINLACKGLLLGEAKMAVAGGVTLITAKQNGYMFQEGMIYSADGHCRSFDKDASGTVSGEGAGVVVLKRLNDAINDGDHIYAVIKGSAINNDGNRKVGYTAPSVEGQVECIKKAQVFAKVDPATISYVETHGTATRLGDPIEIEALNIAFNKNKEKHCAIGSVKSNIGHTDTAAGVAGLIKAILSLKHKQIAPSLNFTAPNPEIDFDGGPFYVNTKLTPWKSKNEEEPLRAAISSFGIGGTNAHAILEEAPEREASSPGRSNLLLMLSAKNENALQRYAGRLKDFIQSDSSLNLADMAYTLQSGRKHFGRRHCIAFSNREELLAALDNPKLKDLALKSKDRSNNVVFMFSGQGSQYANMAKGLYEAGGVFKEELDKGLDALQKITGEDFRAILFADKAEDSPINETKYTQPLLFVVEHALAKLLQSYGINPKQMIGHSIGEYVAACLSGVFSFEDALSLVSTRGSLMNAVAPGSMLSVPITEEEAQQYLSDNVSLAAVNGPQQVVFSGNDEAIEALKATLDGKDVPHITLHTSHAFHSAMQDGILADFKKAAEKVTYNKPQIPFISNLTGELIKEDEAMSPDYWTKHLRGTVKFANGLKTLLSKGGSDAVYIEVGPGQALTSLLKQQPAKTAPIGINLIRPIKDTTNDLQYFTGRVGQLWANGVGINWSAYYEGEKRHRISLPTYAFEATKCPTVVSPFDGLAMSETGAVAATTSDNKPIDAAAPVATTATSGAGAGAAVLPEGAQLPPPMDPAVAAAAGIELGPDGYPLHELTEEQLMKLAENQVEESVVSYEMRQDRPDLSTEFADANTDTEKKLKEMFEGFFGYKQVGIDDNFFELGGDSLKGMVVLKKIKTEFDINISLKDFFGKQTIREIGGEVDEIKMLLQKTTSSSKKSIKI